MASRRRGSSNLCSRAIDSTSAGITVAPSDSSPQPPAMVTEIREARFSSSRRHSSSLPNARSISARAVATRSYSALSSRAVGRLRYSVTRVRLWGMSKFHEAPESRVPSRVVRREERCAWRPRRLGALDELSPEALDHFVTN